MNEQALYTEGNQNMSIYEQVAHALETIIEDIEGEEIPSPRPQNWMPKITREYKACITREDTNGRWVPLEKCEGILSDRFLQDDEGKVRKGSSTTILDAPLTDPIKLSATCRYLAARMYGTLKFLKSTDLADGDRERQKKTGKRM